MLQDKLYECGMRAFETSFGQQLLVCPELDKIGETAYEQIGSHEAKLVYGKDMHCHYLCYRYFSEGILLLSPPALWGPVPEFDVQRSLNSVSTAKLLGRIC